jgi:tetratricopeptide (TPR) repeat protein
MDYMGGVTRHIRQRINGRTLIVTGIVSLGGALVIAILAILGGPEGMTAWLLAVGLLLVLSIVALNMAPKVEAALLVEQSRKLIEGGQFQDALPGLNRAIELSPRLAGAYMARCAAYAGISQIDLAAADAERAVNLAPRLTAPRLLRSRLYSYRGLNDAAIHDLQIGLREKPDWIDGYLELAQLYVRLQDYQSGLATLRDLSLHTPSERMRYDALMMAGGIYEEKLNDLDSAIVSYTRAIPILPDRKIGYLRRAYAYRSRGDLYQAAEDLLRAAQRLPTLEDAGRYHWLRAACYGRRYTITNDERDLAAWISALERSISEDAPSFGEQSRQWLQALRDSHLREEALRQAMSGPPVPRIFPN